MTGFRDRPGSRRLAVGSRLAGALALGALILWATGRPVEPAPSLPPKDSGAARVSASPEPASPSPLPPNMLSEGLPPGEKRSLTVEGVSFSFSVPTERWARYGNLYISKSIKGPQGAEAMIFWAAFPDGTFAHPCHDLLSPPVGPSAADLAEALATTLAGTELVSGPLDVTVGGLGAKQVVLFVRDVAGCGPGLFYTWDDEDARLGPLWGEGQLGDTISVWIVEVGGTRLVIGGETHLNAGAGLEGELQQIVDSISFELPETNLGSGDYVIGRHSVTVDGISLSFEISTPGWEPGPGLLPAGRISINKSVTGPQSAEGIIYWAGFPDAAYADVCDNFARGPVGPSIADVAGALMNAPGTDLVSGPSDATVGGHPAKQIVLTVREALGCDPGYFYAWEAGHGGAFWLTTSVGDTIRVWIIDVNGMRLFIAGETNTIDDATEAELRGLEQELLGIVDSIEFE